MGALSQKEVEFMKFSTRLSLAMVALVGFTATIFGMSSYRTIEAALVPAALERLAAQTRLFKAEIGGQLQGVQADVISFRSGPAPGSIVRTSLNGGVDPIGGVPEIEWHNRFAARLIPIIAGKPAYHQFRVAGLADGGREILRIDHTADYDARLVADSEKLRIGDTDYFRGAINLPLGALYFSPITLTQPDGGDPVRLLMHIATPLRSADGKPFGIFAASIDVNTLL